MLETSLICHPDTPCALLSGFEICIERSGHDGWRIIYTLTGDVAALAIPPAAVPAREDGLWRHTCFELFVRVGSGPGYREFNFSPSGAWAAYGFSGYRTGMAPLSMPEPTISCHAGTGRFELEARLPADALPSRTGLQLAVSAVVEDRQGNLSYWAVCHPAEKPDFHHTGGFVLEL